MRMQKVSGLKSLGAAVLITPMLKRGMVKNPFVLEKKRTYINTKKPKFGI